MESVEERGPLLRGQVEIRVEKDDGLSLGVNKSFLQGATLAPVGVIPDNRNRIGRGRGLVRKPTSDVGAAVVDHDDHGVRPPGHNGGNAFDVATDAGFELMSRHQDGDAGVNGLRHGGGV